MEGGLRDEDYQISGSSVEEKSEELPLEIPESLSEDIDDDVACKLSFCYYHGQGTEQNYEEAVCMFRVSAP